MPAPVPLATSTGMSSAHGYHPLGAGLLTPFSQVDDGQIRLDEAPGGTRWREEDSPSIPFYRARRLSRLYAVASAQISVGGF